MQESSGIEPQLTKQVLSGDGFAQKLFGARGRRLLLNTRLQGCPVDAPTT